MKLIRLLLLLSLLSGLFGAHDPAAQAQEDDAPAGEETPPGEEPGIPRVHVVQEGENLTTIAAQYEITVQALQLVNGLDDDDVIFPGQELIIPGAEGDVVATTYTVQAGDSVESVAAMFNTTAVEVAEANRLVSTDNLAVGQTLSVISKTGNAEPRPITGTLHYVREGETMLGIAARYGLAPRTIAELNELPFPPRLFPGMRLRIPGEEPFQLLPGSWQTVRLGPLPVSPGQAVSIYVENDLDGTPGGVFAEQTLRFAPHDEGYVALVGLDAFAEPGQYQLELYGSGEAPWWPLRQEVEVNAANFLTQTINLPETLAALLDPQVRADEDAYLATFYGEFTPQQQWDGLFQTPVTTTVVTAPYGDIRSYNGGPFEIFHTGVDYAGTTGTPILAPAAGTVVFTGTLELRGGTVIIDHGLGVHSGYYHLSQVEVDVGEQISAGQIIGSGGSTGLSTGPHLHWELRVLDVPVNGVQWTEVVFP